MKFSADPDARWIKKGRTSTLGYKGFARCDDEGYVDKVHVTPANKAESPEFETMIKDAHAQRVLAELPIEGAIGSSPMGDAYASKANRAAIKGKHRDGILHRPENWAPVFG